MMKRALLVGIDHYNNSPLGGCANDAESLALRLATNLDTGSSNNFDCKTVVGREHPGVTRDELKMRIRECFGPGTDVALFFFAGHGAERSGEDVALCTSDMTSETPGVEFSFVMEQIAKSSAQEKIVILDCCFSGGAGGVPQLGLGEGTFLPPGTTILAASRGDQVSMEEGGSGLFTTAMCLALDGGAADVLGNINAAGVYRLVDQLFGAWGQRPTLRTNVDELHTLRTCEPSISLPDLRTLATIFADLQIDYPLDPSYEPEAEPRVAEHEQLFAVLQTARASQLVVPVDEDHLYFAAMNNKACRLTPLGKYYCRLIHEGLI